MKHLNKIFVIMIIILLFLLLIIALFLMQTTRSSLPSTIITLENTTILGKILG
jgi:hypothetical protein